MRTEERFLADTHARARRLSLRRDRRLLTLWGTACAALLLPLLYLVISPRTPGTGMLTGTSLLAASAGGYVLVAVLAFMAGVVFTVALRWKQAKNASPDGYGGGDNRMSEGG